MGSQRGSPLSVRKYILERAKKRRDEEKFMDQMTNELRFRSKQAPESIE